MEIRGKLINYEMLSEEGNPIGRIRDTSKNRWGRQSFARSSCERIQILKESQLPFHEIRTFAGITALVSGVVLVGLFFLSAIVIRKWFSIY